MDSRTGVAEARGGVEEAGAMTRALVLGGGGPLGLAWECGLIAGFAQAGVDLGQADYILGTSAGAITGARLASGVPSARMAEALIDPASTLIRPPMPPSFDAVVRLSALFAETQSGARNPAEVRREMGALSLGAATAGEAEFIDAIRREGDLPRQGWPARTYACTAVDVEDGGFQIWEAGSGVELLPAVASSCSVPGLFPAITLDGRRYMDGGTRTPTNADMAVGHEIVVVIAVQPQGAPDWMAKGLDAEVESLQAGGATVVCITMDEGSTAAYGVNAMDASRKPDAARAGLAQAAGQAAVLKEVWG
jgi:NTE family protein